MIRAAPSSEKVTSAADVALPDAPSSTPVPEELRQLVRRERMAVADGWVTSRHLAVILVAWAGVAAGAIAIDRWWIWVPAWGILAGLTATPLALMHEAVHHNLYRSRILNHLVGTLAASVLFFHGPAYRAWHLTHHAYTFEPQDSEQLPSRFGSRIHYLAYCAVLGPLFAVVLWVGALGTLLGRAPTWIGTSRLRAHVRRWSLPPVLALGGLLTATALWPSVMGRAWLVPAVLASVVVFPLLTMPEHFGGRGVKHLLGNTRTTESNPLVRFLYWNNNYHAAHHLLPTVPPQSLPRVDALIAPHNPLRAPGFLAFHAAVLRAGGAPPPCGHIATQREASP